MAARPKQAGMIDAGILTWTPDNSFFSKKLFCQLETLTLIVRANSLTIKFVRRFDHVFEDQSSNPLAVVEHKWNIMAPDFENDLTVITYVKFGFPEEWIQKTRIMYAYFANSGIISYHFGSFVFVDLNVLKRGHDIELVRHEDELRPAGAALNRLPEIVPVILSNLLKIDQASGFARPIRDDAIGSRSFQIN